MQVSYGEGKTTVSHPRNLILVGETAQVSLIETFVSVEHDTTFTNTVTEIVAAEGALVDYTKVQQESDAATTMRACRCTRNVPPTWRRIPSNWADC